MRLNLDPLAAAKPRVVGLVGPTGVGKTRLAVEAARRLGAEVVNADALQVYRHMDIGSAKPTLEERARVPHHLVDEADPTRPLNAAAFGRRAREVIASLAQRGVLPLLVSGSGLYFRAILQPIFEGPGAQPEVRRRFHHEASRLGPEALHERLRGLDPAYAAKIHPNDLRRVVRALEVYEVTGRPFSSFFSDTSRADAPFLCKVFGLTAERPYLYDQINERVLGMVRDGLVEEVRRLVEMGCDEGHSSMQGLGYRQMLRHLRGEISLERAVELAQRDSRHFAKRQMTWFRKLGSATWIDLTPGRTTLEQAVAQVVEETRKWLHDTAEAQ